MTLEQFEQQIMENLQDGWREDSVISLQHMYKNNQQEVCALYMSHEKEEIAPVIYLDEYYRKWKEGMEIQEILLEIRRDYDLACQCTPPDVSFLYRFQKAQELIFFQLVHCERNQNLLDHCPHLVIGDLLLIFRCLAFTDDGQMGSVFIDNHLLKIWNVSQRELMVAAARNTPVLFPARIYNIEDFIEDIGLGEKVFGKDGIPMLILTNQWKMNGAAVILYEDFLKELAEEYHADFYLLPSSIHEMILLPVRGDEDQIEELKQIVKEANENVLQPGDILSDNVYIYRREKNSLEIASH